MSLRKTYEQALQNQTTQPTALEAAYVDVVNETVAAIRRDGDFTARVTDISYENGFELEVRSNLGRVGRTVTLSLDEVAAAYQDSEGDLSAASSDLMENVVKKVAYQQAHANRIQSLKGLLRS